MGKKYTDKDVVLGKDIKSAMATFAPRFGNQLDIDVMREYDDLVNLLSLQKRDEARRKKIKEITKTNLERKKQIAKSEARILWLLKKI